MNLGGAQAQFKQSQICKLDLVREVVDGQHIVVLTELSDRWYRFIRDQIPGWGFRHDGLTSAIMYDTAVCTCRNFEVKKIFPDESESTILGWRTILWARLDFGAHHPHHLVTACHVVAGSRHSDTEDHRVPSGKSGKKLKEDISLAMIKAVFTTPSIVAGIIDCSTIVHL